MMMHLGSDFQWVIAGSKVEVLKVAKCEVRFGQGKHHRYKPRFYVATLKEYYKDCGYEESCAVRGDYAFLQSDNVSILSVKWIGEILLLLKITRNKLDGSVLNGCYADHQDKECLFWPGDGSGVGILCETRLEVIMFAWSQCDPMSWI